MDNLNRYKIISDNYFDLIVEYNGNLELLSQFLDEYSYIILDERYAVIYVPLEESVDDAFYKYSYNNIPTCNGLMSSISLDSCSMAQVRNNESYNLDGNGVLIGIIDTGVDYTNPALLCQDGSTRITSIWDQSIDSDDYPEGYYYGSQYSRDAINFALLQRNPFSYVPTRDEIGHGTALATIAGGSPKPETEFSGVATHNDFVIVKLKEAKDNIRSLLRIPRHRPCYQSNDIMFAIRYLMDEARRLRRPIAICIGVSTSQGSNVGLSRLDEYISRQGLEIGYVFLVPAGNEGYVGHHYKGIINDSGYDEFRLNVGKGGEGFSMEFWGSAPNLYSVDMYGPDDTHLGTIPAIVMTNKAIHRFTYGNTILYVDSTKETHSGAQLIIFRFSNPARGIWRFRVNCECVVPFGYDVWLPINNFITNNTYLINGDYLNTLTGPANAHVPLSVTAYNPMNNELYNYSSSGFPRSQIIKPDIAAPGVNITASTIGNQLINISGTSAATAYATGAVALMLEWGIVQGNDRNMNTNDVKKFFNFSANRDSNIQYPNPFWGYGKLNIHAALQYASSTIL